MQAKYLACSSLHCTMSLIYIIYTNPAISGCLRCRGNGEGEAGHAQLPRDEVHRLGLLGERGAKQLHRAIALGTDALDPGQVSQPRVTHHRVQ